MTGELPPHGMVSQTELQRRFMRVFCWLCLSTGSVALLAGWVIMDLSPHLHSPATVLGICAAYGCAAWVLADSRETFQLRHALALLLVTEAALLAMLMTMRPTESAVGVLLYLSIPLLMAAFLLPARFIWWIAAFNIVGIAAFAGNADPEAVELARMTAARAFVVQLSAATALWFFATRIAELITAQTRQLEERETLLKEIHHRVKNNLQIVSSLLGLQSQGAGSDEVREVLDESRRRVLAIAAAHDAVYRGLNLGRVSLRRYIDDLVRNAKRATIPASISISTDVASVEAELEEAVPIGLVASELLMNSLKHAFPGRDTGTVHVTLTEEPTTLRLVVADDGVGIPADAKRNGQTLGFALITALAQQLGAELSFADGPGTRVELSIPRHTDGAAGAPHPAHAEA